MTRSLRWLSASALLLAMFSLGSGPALGDGSTGATTTDAWAKERADEFKELEKKKKRALKDGARKLEILKELERAPCRTSQRFLLGLLKKKSTPGDHRLYALRSLSKMADQKTLDAMLSILIRAKDATLWQAFGEALASSPGEAVQAWLVGPGLRAKQAAVLSACLEGLRRRPVAACRERIAALYERHAADGGDVDVACRALRALSSAKAPGIEATLIGAIRHEDWRLRLVAAGRLPGRDAFSDDVQAAVRHLLQDEEAYVRQAVAAACGRAKRKALAGELILLLADPRIRTRQVASVALEQISGLKLGLDHEAWTRWNHQQDPGTPKNPSFPSYHGFPVISDRVVFLVDASSSMTWPWRKPTKRIDVARSELASVLGQLTPDTLFNVIVFSEKPRAWKKIEVLASPASVSSALKWVPAPK